MKLLKFIIGPVFLMAVFSCSEDSTPTLRDDYLMKTVAPAIPGETLELQTPWVQYPEPLRLRQQRPILPGWPGTGFDNKSYHTDSRGNDVGIVVTHYRELLFNRPVFCRYKRSHFKIYLYCAPGAREENLYHFSI